MDKQSPDGRLLEELTKSGSDLAAVHHFDFFLRFPTQKAAQQAEFKIIQLAFVDTTITRDQAGNDWVLKGSKNMYPVESDLQGLRDKLDIVAAEGNGKYEVWHARLLARDK